MTEREIHSVAIDLSNRLWDRMRLHPSPADVVEVAGRVFCATVEAAGVTLPTALAAVQSIWMAMHGKPGDRA